MRTIIFLGLLVLTFVYGVAVGTYRIFPFEQLRYVRNLVRPAAPVNEAPRFRTTLFEVFSPDVDIVMVGDSITAMGAWSDVLPRDRVANRGVGRDTSLDIQARLDTILSVTPDTAFLMFGINDLTLIGRTPQEVLVTYEQIIVALRQNGIRVVIQSTLQCTRVRCGEVYTDIAEINDGLRALARQYDLSFVDLNVALADDGGLKPAVTQDGTHLTADGYQLWVQVLKSYLEDPA